MTTATMNPPGTDMTSVDSAAITIEKHIYHMPIHRQLERFKSLGVTLPSSTVEHWQRLIELFRSQVG